MKTLIYNVKTVSRHEPNPTWLVIDGGQVIDSGSDAPAINAYDQAIDGGGKWLLPGFMDTHVHGSVGHDVMDATPDALYEMSKFFARHGVTAWTPTTLTHHHDALMAALINIKQYMADQPPDGAQVIGARLEGPYLNVEKAGAQNPQYIRLPKPDEVNELLDLDVIKILDVAPEVEGADWLIQECARRGIVASAAHTNATYEQMMHAHEIGLSHATHTFNAMSPLNHRAPGVVGAVLSTPTISAEVISDFVHVHPAAVKILAEVKKNRRMISLITDAIRPAGMPEGEYAFDERTVVHKDGAIRLTDGVTLAGSALTMNRAADKYAKLVHEPQFRTRYPSTALMSEAASDAPARLLRLKMDTRTDLILVDDDINVYMTIINGRIVYRAEGI